jgi:hypothetical protein
MFWIDEHPGPMHAVITDHLRAKHIVENPLMRKRSKNWSGLVELNDSDRRKGRVKDDNQVHDLPPA